MNRNGREAARVGGWPVCIGLAGVGSLACGASGQISFGQREFYPVEGHHHAINTGDLNADGLMDIALGGYGIVRLLTGQPDGSFESYQTLKVASDIHFVFDVKIGDMDADGRLDLAWGGIDRRDLRIGIFFVDEITKGGLLGEQLVFDEVMIETERSLDLGDIDSDGDLDLLYLQNDEVYDPNRRTTDLEHRVVVQRNLGARNFERDVVWSVMDWTPDRTHNLIDLIAGDVDGDGDLDALTLQYHYQECHGCYESQVTRVIALANNDGSFESITTYSSEALPWRVGLDLMGVFAADLNGDGVFEAIVAGNSQFDIPAQFIIMEATNGLRYAGVATIKFNEAARLLSPVTADLELDGDIDLIGVPQGESSTPTIIENLGNYKFGSQAPIGGEAFVNAVHVADTDNDGLWDLIATTSGGVLLWRNTTPIGQRQLDVSNVRRGGNVTASIDGIPPGQPVHFLYSLNGVGHSRGYERLGGMTLDLAEPIVARFSAVADANGVATITVRFPSAAPHTTIGFQAVVVRQGPGWREAIKSTFVSRRVED